jgi:hypothetical protein
MKQFLVLLSLLLTFSTQAVVKKHEIEKEKSIRIDVPAGWESVKDLFGMPLSILGPFDKDSRPALMVLYTNLSMRNFNKAEFEAHFMKFRAEKDAWVRSHDGTLNSFTEVTKTKLSPTVEGVYIGSEFVMKNITFLERSYYVYCDEDVYNIKWSIREAHKKHLPVLEKIVSSFQCK